MEVVASEKGRTLSDLGVVGPVGGAGRVAEEVAPTLLVISELGDELQFPAKWRLWLLELGYRTFELTYESAKRGVLAAVAPTIIVISDANSLRAASHCRAIRRIVSAYIIVVDPSRSPESAALLAKSGADHFTSALPEDPWVPEWLAGLAKRCGFGSDDGGGMQFGDLAVDLKSRSATFADRLLPLTKIEFDVLALLASEPNRVFTRSEILEAVWDGSWHGDGAMLDVHIANLRKKLGDSGRDQRWIKTVRGVGFLFVPQPREGKQPKLSLPLN